MPGAVFPRIVPAGDEAAMVVFGEHIDEAFNDAVLQLDAALATNEIPGALEVVPALASLLVRFDPEQTSFGSVRAQLVERIDSGTDLNLGSRRHWTIPVTYGGSFGPHLDEAAALVGVDTDELADRHAAQHLRVLMLGFAPGFAYLGVGDEVWDLPRRPEIVAEVAPGSVILAVRQTGLCATAMPTGWWVLGNTPTRLFDPGRDDPFLLAPGDTVEFERISVEEHGRLASRIANGVSPIPPEST